MYLQKKNVSATIKIYLQQKKCLCNYKKGSATIKMYLQQ